MASAGCAQRLYARTDLHAVITVCRGVLDVLSIPGFVVSSGYRVQIPRGCCVESKSLDTHFLLFLLKCRSFACGTLSLALAVYGGKV
jgi:hypothetical protein